VSDQHVTPNVDALSDRKVGNRPTSAKRSFAWAGAGIRLFILILIGALVFVVIREWNWWVSSSALQSTDDAYLQADTTPLAAKVPGYVSRALVQDFQRVHGGDVLVVLERMLAAIERGVRVRILCGGKHGLHQPDLMYSFALWRLMHQAGAKVHKQKNLRAHAKLLVVDDKWALLGSQNFDQPAFDLRREVAIEMRDAAIVQDLTSVFERDWETSRKYEPPYPIDKPAEEEEVEFSHDAALMHD
jgi:hypothetical protein